MTNAENRLNEDPMEIDRASDIETGHDDGHERDEFEGQNAFYHHC